MGIYIYIYTLYISFTDTDYRFTIRYTVYLVYFSFPYCFSNCLSPCHEGLQTPTKNQVRQWGAMFPTLWVCMWLPWKVGVFEWTWCTSKCTGHDYPYIKIMIERAIGAYPIFRHTQAFGCTLSGVIDVQTDRYCTVDIRSKGIKRPTKDGECKHREYEWTKTWQFTITKEDSFNCHVWQVLMKTSICQVLGISSYPLVI